MSRNNTIGIVGRIKTQPKLIIDAADWERKVYETTLIRMRPSGTPDTYILQFDGRAAGTKEMLEKITEGTEVLIGGEIRSENMHDPKPEENRVKVYIYAEVIALNNAPVNDQNEVTICGHICKKLRFQTARRRAKEKRHAAVANIIVAVNSRSGTNYVPCACFGWQALKANTLEIGDYVEIYGRFQSRDHKKRIEGRELPFLSMVYEVCAIKLDSETKKKEVEPEKEGRSDT